MRIRKPSERVNHHEWTPVTRKKPFSHRHHHHPRPLASQTTYVKILPPSFNVEDVSKIFIKYGPIINITLLEPSNKNLHFQYAFVKFMARHSLHQAIIKEDTKNMEGKRLQVEIAKFDTVTPAIPASKTPSKTPHGHPSFKTPIPKSLWDHQTYKEASLNQKQSSKKIPFPSNHEAQAIHQKEPPSPNQSHINSPSHVYFSLQQFEPQLDFFNKEIYCARIMCSRVLGKDVEKAKIDLETGDVDEETIGLIKIKKCSYNDEL